MRIINAITIIIVILFAFYNEAVLAEKPGTQHLDKEETHQPSGFLDNYNNFKVLNPKTKAQVWIKPPHQDLTLLNKYNSVLLSPIEIWMSSSTYQGIASLNSRGYSKYCH